MVTSRYVVTLRDDVADVIGTADKLAKRLGGVRRHVYGSTIKGFSLVNLSDRALAELRADPRGGERRRSSARSCSLPRSAAFPSATGLVAAMPDGGGEPQVRSLASTAPCAIE